MAVTIDGTTGVTTPGVVDTGNLSVTGTSTLTGGITGAAVNLASNVTGTLPIANGGTGTTSTTFANLTTNVTGTLPIANGGTNSTATATAGGIGYGTGTAHAYTAAGTLNQVLISNGAGAPTWGSATPTAAQGASMVLVTTVTASSSSTVDVEDAMTDYDEYVILIDGVKPSVNSSILEGLLKIGGSYITTSTYQTTFQTISTTGTGISGTATDAYPKIQYTIANVTNVSTQNLNGAVWITRPSSTSAYPTLRYDFAYGSSNVTYYQRYIFGFINNSTTGSAVTGLRFSFDSGTIVTGSFRLYGFKKS